MSDAVPRSRDERIRDTIARFEQDVDAWVATAAPAGEPHLVPLSFLWWNQQLVIATEDRSPTIRNLRASPSIRLGIGLVRDVILVTGTATLIPAPDIDRTVADAFATKAGFDPRESSGSYTYAFVTPTSIRAWREVDELPNRDLMKSGAWL